MTKQDDGGAAFPQEATTTITSQLREDLIALLDRLRSAQEHDYETSYFVLMSLMEALLHREEGRLMPFNLSARKEPT